MKKIALTILLAITFAFPYYNVAWKNIIKNDTLSGAVADTISFGTLLVQNEGVALFARVDTIGDASVSMIFKIQVSPNDSNWIDYKTAVFGDSIIIETEALTLDTVKLNTASAYSNGGIFRYMRMIATNYGAAVKGILNLWACLKR